MGGAVGRDKAGTKWGQAKHKLHARAATEPLFSSIYTVAPISLTQGCQRRSSSPQELHSSTAIEAKEKEIAKAAAPQKRDAIRVFKSPSSNGTASGDGWVLAASTAGESRGEELSRFHSFAVEAHACKKDDEGNTELGDRNVAVCANLCSGDADAEPGQAETAAPAAASAPVSHADSYSSWNSEEDDTHGPYPVYMQREESNQVPTVKPFVPVHDAVSCPTPLSGGGNPLLCQKSNNAGQQPSPPQDGDDSAKQNPMTSGKVSPPALSPSSLVAWRAPPAPPAPSPLAPRRHTQQQQQQQQQHEANQRSTVVSSLGAFPEEEAAIEVVTVPPPKPKGVTSRIAMSIAYVETSGAAKQKARTRGHAKHHAMEEQRLTRLGSILGASPHKLEPVSPWSRPSSAFRPASRLDDGRESVTPRLSAPLSVTPSLRVTSESSLRWAFLTKESSLVHVKSPLGPTTVTPASLFGPSPAPSATNFDIEGSSGRRGRTEQYGSFVSAFTAAMAVRTATSGRALSPMAATAEEPPPARSSKAASAVVGLPSPPPDENGFLMLGGSSSKAATQPTEKAVTKKGSAEDALDTSLLNLSLTEEKQAASPDRSPMDSPTELFLPYARNLRPRQWQYASMLYKKIEEKEHEKSIKKMQPTSPQGKLSAAAFNIPGASATTASRPASPQMKGQPPQPQQPHQLPKFSAKPTTAQKQRQDSASPRVEMQVDREENSDVFDSNYFSNNGSVVFPPSARVAPTAASGPAAAAVERAACPTSTSVRLPATTRGEKGLNGTKKNEADVRTLSRADVAPSSLHSDITSAHNNGSRNEKAELKGRVMSRMSSLLSINSSVFTDNGHPLIQAHVSDFYKDSYSSTGMSSTASVSATLEGSRERIQPVGAVVDGRLVMQGVGYASKPLSNSSTLDLSSTPTKRVQHLQLVRTSDESKMPTMKGRGPSALLPQRWNASMSRSPAMRHQMLHEQQRRLLREQQLYVRQLRNNERPPPPPPGQQSQQQEHPSAFLVGPPVMDNSPRCEEARAASSRPEVGSLHVMQQQQLQQQQQQPLQVPSPLPISQSPTALASAFFASNDAKLNVKHCGTTGEAYPQPDIKYGPFVATDRSHNIDLKKTLGFGLEDVPTILSPNWDSLPLPELNEDSEEL